MPFRKQRTATFHDKEIFKVLPMDGVPTSPIVIDGTTVSAGGDGRYVLEAGTLMCKTAAVVARDQIDSLAITATGGTWAITINGATVDELAYNITNTNLEAALEGLPTVDPGDVAVTGGPGATNPLVLTFGGNLADQPVTVAIEDSTLTGPAAGIVDTQTIGRVADPGTKARPAAANGEQAADILGILTHTVEFFYPPEAGITDEPASVYYAWGHFDTTKLVNYSGNSAAVATALPHCIFS